MVQWLRLHNPTAGSIGLMPGQETKILHATQCVQTKTNKQKKKVINIHGRIVKRQTEITQQTCVDFYKIFKPLSLTRPTLDLHCPQHPHSLWDQAVVRTLGHGGEHWCLEKFRDL